MDFRAGDGDVINLAATELTWSDLDSNGNDVLDDDDAFVASAGGLETSVDLGAATGASADLNVMIVVGVTGLAEGDFLFV